MDYALCCQSLPTSSHQGTSQRSHLMPSQEPIFEIFRWHGRDKIGTIHMIATQRWTVPIPTQAWQCAILANCARSTAATRYHHLGSYRDRKLSIFSLSLSLSRSPPPTYFSYPAPEPRLYTPSNCAMYLSTRPVRSVPGGAPGAPGANGSLAGVVARSLSAWNGFIRGLGLPLPPLPLGRGLGGGRAGACWPAVCLGL